MKKLFGILGVSLSCLFMTGQIAISAAEYRPDTLRVNVEFDASVSSNPDIRPLWSWSQSWGRYTQTKTAEALIRTGATWKLLDGKVGSLELGATLQASTDLSRMMVDEAYVRGKLWQLDYTLGYEAFTPIDQFNGLSLGSYLMSDNARTAPKVGIGFFDWWAVPHLKHWLEFKGGIYFGLSPECSKAITHEKFLYARIGGWYVKPYIGLVHSALMGGVYSDGTPIPIDFWATFFARGSSRLNDAGFDGEYTNAAGGHQGMWDLGLAFETNILDGTFWYRRPFCDSNAMNLFRFAYCKDYNLGLDLKIKHFAPVREVCVEFMNYDWQGGQGLPDPIFVSEKTGEVVYFAWQGMTKENIQKYFSEETIKEWESKHGELSDFDSCKSFFEHYTNNDFPFGGRSAYLTNYCYPYGWITNGLPSSSAPFLSASTMALISPNSSFNTILPGTRFRSVNAGISGNIIPQITYRAKCTVTRYSGNWNDYYAGQNWTWELTPNYYFAEPKWECSTGLWIDWKATRKISVFGSMFADFGQMYGGFAARAGIRYRITP